MDSERGKQLLEQERNRIAEALASLKREGPAESDERREPGDYGDENLYQDEYDAGRERELKEQLDAVERAERRLADGTFGISIRSGEPIPDARLEIQPTAELTVEEQDPR